MRSRTWQWLVVVGSTALVAFTSLSVGRVTGFLSVTPDNESSGNVAANTSGYVANFTVSYTGDEMDPTETFNLSCSGTLGISCSVSQSSVMLIPNSSAGIDVTFSTSSSTGTGYVSLYADGFMFDGGSRYYQIGSAVTVDPVSVPSSILQHEQDVGATFSVHNGSGFDHNYALTCEWGGGPCTAPGSVYVGVGLTENVAVTFDAGAIPAAMTLKLTATEGADTDFEASAVTVGEYLAVNALAQKGTVYAVPSVARTDTFVVRFPGQPAASFAMSVSCPGGTKASSCSVVPSDQTLSVGDTPVKVRVTYTAGINNDTSNVTLTATNVGSGFPTQQGALRVVSTNAILLNVADANPGLEHDFGECLNVSAGAGGIVCDDYQYVYPFPAVVRRNTPRQIGLIYNSGMRAPHGVLGANFVLPLGVAEPSSIAATLKINGTTVRTQTYGNALYAPGEERRIAFDWFATGAGADRQLLNYEMTLVPTGQSSVTKTGKFVTLDTNDRYGAGWWIAGLEALVVQGDTLVWTGGDGSARAYFKNVAGKWIAQSRDRPDTIVTSGQGYLRKILGGGEVQFDTAGAYGMHARTISRNADTTFFDHSLVGSLRRLTSIRVGAADTVFKLLYSASTSGIDTVFVRSDGTGWDKWKVNTSVANGTLHLSSIVAPGGTTTSFLQQTSSANSGRLDWIRQPGGDTTRLTYINTKVSSVAIDTVASGVAITLGYLPGSTIGRLTSGSTWQTPKPPDSLSSRFDGPLTIAADTTRFFTTGWGALRGIRNHKGQATWIDRGDPTYASLPTRVRSPNGLELVASYYHDGVHDGLLEYVIDRSNGALTSYRWNQTFSKPDTIVTPEGMKTTFSYDAKGNLLAQRVVNDSVRYVYNASGLVTSMTDPEGNVSKFGYDAWLNLSGDTTAISSIWTQYVRDGRGMPLTVTRPFGTASNTTVVTTSYDVFGRDSLVRTTNNLDASWLEVRHTYNANGLRILTSPRGGLTAPENDSTGSSQWVYDKLGRLRVNRTAVASDTMTYDAAGNVLSVRQGGYTITMVYDTLSRLTRRIVPSRFHGAETIGGYTFPHYAPSGFTIPPDTTRFTYDVMGNMLTANDGDSRITRAYALNGALETDSLALKDYGSSGFSTHGYRLAYHYDRDGRRVALDHPAWLSPGSDRTSYQVDATTGLLSNVTDPSGSAWQFLYNRNGQPKRITYPAGQDSLAYDALGRTTALISSHVAATLVYDKASRITTEGGVSGGTFNYNPFGHLKDSEINVDAGFVKQDFETDVFGNRTFSITFGPGNPWDEPPGSAYVDSYQTGNEVLLSGSTGVWEFPPHPVEPQGWSSDNRSYVYDFGKMSTAITSDKAWNYIPLETDQYYQAEISALMETRTRNYYTADGKVAVVQVTRDSIAYLDLSPLITDTTATWGAYEDYWYDALGRRVLKRTRQEGPLCSHPARCFGAMERSVWDGDQLLWELRSEFLDAQNPGAAVQTGRVGYTHAGGIDAPLGMVRNDTTIVLHRGGRGLYVKATNSAGTVVGSDVPWPGSSADAQGALIDPRDTHTWIGSLGMGQQDESGLTYRRNRYYDPTSGRFTQQDPIGIAGGINLYGYANGDPINFSDPFGLCPKDGEDEECEAVLAQLREFDRNFSESTALFGRVADLLDASRRDVEFVSATDSRMDDGRNADDDPNNDILGATTVRNIFLRDDMGLGDQLATMAHEVNYHPRGIPFPDGRAVTDGYAFDRTFIQKLQGLTSLTAPQNILRLLTKGVWR